MRKYVDTTHLNFCSAPKFDSNIIKHLHLGYPVEVVDDADGEFVKVKVEIGGSEREGFLSERFLRDPVSDHREALILQAIREWKRFDFGLGQEHRKPYFKFVGAMWKSLGLNFDGKDRDIPWASAAISLMVRNAGKASSGSRYSKFKFAASGARLVQDAIKRRNKGDTSSPFWGFDLHEKRPQLGDMVCRHYEGRDFDFNDARNSNAFKSHSDIIVRIKDDTVTALGGNVSHSVKVTEYDLTVEAFLDDTKRVYAILVNQH